MSIRCPRCQHPHEAARLSLGPPIRCPCGTFIGGGLQRALHQSQELARRKGDRLQRMADRVCSLILNEQSTPLEIELEKSKVRQTAMRLFPDREDLYEMIYESRFQRLWRQFRPPPAGGAAP